MKSIKSIFRLKRRYKTGLILSGGGARGFAHAGILKALNESGIYPDVISGVSAGAIVGALYADGHTPDQIFEIFSSEKSFFKYVKPKMPGKGIFKTVGLKENLAENLTAVTFEELKLPLYVAATNIHKGEITYFNTGKILDKVLASAAIPVLFEPVEIDGNLYVDGGVLDNFPVTPIVKECRELIGISLNPIHPEDNFNHLIKIAERTFRLSVSSNISSKTGMCDRIFEPEAIGSYGLLDASKGSDIFEMGYEYARHHLRKA
jgi:NTE family protein